MSENKLMTSDQYVVQELLETKKGLQECLARNLELTIKLQDTQEQLNNIKDLLAKAFEYSLIEKTEYGWFNIKVNNYCVGTWDKNSDENEIALFKLIKMAKGEE